MKEVLVIVGAGSVGGHIAMNPELYGMQERDIKFVDDDETKLRNGFLGFEVMGNVNSLLKVNTAMDVVLGIAFPHIKHIIYNKLKTNKYLSFPSFIANNSWISNNISIGKGCIIYPNCSINYGSSIGDFVVMNMNCAIGHDCSIGSLTSLAPGVSLGGHTHIGEQVEMGIGSVTKQGINIGANSIVGGQSMIINDIPAHSRVVGVPAKSLHSQALYRKI